MDKQQKPQRVLVVGQPTIEWRFGGIKAYVSHYDSSKDCGFSTELYADTASNVEFGMQASEGTEHWYGERVYWAGTRYMTTWECQKAMKALKPIETALSAIYHQFGNIKTPGEWFARCAVALKAKRIVVIDESSIPSTGSKYSIYTDFPSAISHINKLAAETLSRVQSIAA